MAYKVPLDQPLTETQAELVGKMNSMKNLMSLDFLKKFRISKDDQISTFDYILKIMRSMGIDPVVLLTSFINEFFETAKLVDFVIKGSAQLAAAVKINLDPNSTIQIGDNASKDEKEAIVDVNFNYLSTALGGLMKETLTAVIEGLKMQMIKDLMTLIFGGPKKPSGQDVMSELQDPDRMEELVVEVYCGAEVFSASSSNERNEDLEYNRIQLKERAEKGVVAFRVTCQGIEVSLPDDPGYLFSDTPPGVVSSNPTTPHQALTNCINHVANQTQKGAGGSGQGTAASNSKSFAQMMIEKLITHVVVLLKPLFMGMITPIPTISNNPLVADAMADGYDGIFAEIQAMLEAQGRANEAATFNPGDLYPPNSCDIMGWGPTPDSWTEPQKRKSLLIRIICNMILNAVIAYLVAYLMKKIKEWIQKYIIKKAVKKAKEKLAKIKQKYASKRAEVAQKNQKKAARQIRLLNTLKSALSTASSTHF